MKISSDAGISLDVPYGKDSGFKTILHLALEMEDGELYVEELIKVGVFYNRTLKDVA